MVMVKDGLLSQIVYWNRAASVQQTSSVLKLEKATKT